MFLNDSWLPCTLYKEALVIMHRVMEIVGVSEQTSSFILLFSIQQAYHYSPPNLPLY